MNIKYRRADGSFVAVVNGMDYHVTRDNPLFGQAQIDGANAPAEPDPVFSDPVPTALTKLQIKREAEARGGTIWADMKAYIAADDDRQEEWELASTVEVHGSLITDAATALLTPLGITRDEFAIEAAKR